MAEEDGQNIWTKLSFDVDLEKNEVKQIVDETTEEAPEPTQEAGQPEQADQEEDKKRPSRTERLKRQRDKALEEAERLRIALMQTQQRMQETGATVDTAMRSQFEITKKALESKKEAAQKAFLNAFEQGDKDALLAAQTALVEVDGDIRELSTKVPPKPDSDQNPPQRVEQPIVQKGPSPKTKAWIAANPWFDDDEEMRGAALGIHTKLLKDGVEAESDEYFEGIEARMRKLFPEKFDEDDEEEEVKPKPKAKGKVPPVSGSGQNKGDSGRVRLRVTKDDQEAARRLGVPLDMYMLNKGKIEEVGYDPNKRENSYVKIF